MLNLLDNHFTQNLSFLLDQRSDFLPHFDTLPYLHWETTPFMLGCWLGWWHSLIYNNIEVTFVVVHVKN